MKRNKYLSVVVLSVFLSLMLLSCKNIQHDLPPQESEGESLQNFESITEESSEVQPTEETTEESTDAPSEAPTEKDGPTEPETTDVEATKPMPTEPRPTEPKPKEPKPTEPKPTEPKPTETEPPTETPTEPTSFEWSELDLQKAMTIGNNYAVSKYGCIYDPSLNADNAGYDFPVPLSKLEIISWVPDLAASYQSAIELSMKMKVDSWAQGEIRAGYDPQGGGINCHVYLKNNQLWFCVYYG